MRIAHLDVHFERTLHEAATSLLTTRLSHVHANTAILPSSMDREDLVAQQVLESLPPGASGEILVPVSGSAARRAFFLPTVLGEWRDAPLKAEDAALSSVLLPTQILRSAHRVIAVNIVEVARHGPFVLDLPARYVHPRNRLRLVADKERSARTAEVMSAINLDLIAIALILPEGCLVVTTADVIAAELIALTLAERCVGGAKSFTGPWEDDVVQRATELQLGALLPNNIRISVSGSAANEPWAADIRDHIRRRMGLTHITSQD